MLHIEAVLMHIGQFVKDNTLHFSRPSQLQTWQSLLQSKLCGLVPRSQMRLLENTPSSTRLKEDIAMAAEPSNNLLLVYYAGCVILRKDRLYLATTESTAALAHVNAVPVEQVLDILRESNAKRILWLVDATYRQEQSEQSAFAVWKETLHRYPELSDRLSCGLVLQPVEEQQHTSPMDDLLAQISQGLPDLQQEQLSLHDFWQRSLAHAPGTLWISEVEQPFRWIANAHLLRKQQAENWIAEADHYFEVDKFEKALILYRQAAEVLPSEELSEAIALSERWIRKEQAIRSRMEEQLWSHVREWDTPQGYAFYLNVFPEGVYKEQAQSIIPAQQSAADIDVELPAVQQELPQQELAIDGLIGQLADAPLLEPLLTKIAEQLGDDDLQLPRQECAELQQPVVAEEMSVPEIDAPAFVVEVAAVDSVEEEQPVEEFAQESEVHAEVEESVEEFIQESEIHAETEPVQESLQESEVQLEQPVLETPQQNMDVEVVAQLEVLPESELAGMSETQLWDYVRQINTVASYRTYLSVSKENTYMKDAYYAIHQLGREDLPDPEPLVVTPVQEEVPQVVQVDEEALWAEAQAEDTIAAYMQYLNQSSENRYIPNAYARISALKLEASRKPVQRQPEQSVVASQSVEIAALEVEVIVAEEEEPIQESFLQDIDSHNVDHVQAEEEEAAQVVLPQTQPVQVEIPASLSVLQTDPIDRTAGVEEEQLWQKALADHTLSAYFNYLNRTTEKIYWTEAKQRIAQLKEDAQAKEEQEWEKTCQEDTIEAYKQYVKRYPLGNYYAQATTKLNSFHADSQ